jgi:hypothetical protein
MERSFINKASFSINRLPGVLLLLCEMLRVHFAQQQKDGSSFQYGREAIPNLPVKG